MTKTPPHPKLPNLISILALLIITAAIPTGKTLAAGFATYSHSASALVNSYAGSVPDSRMCFLLM